MTDDIMSDCVGGDYIIVKNRKNHENGGPLYEKGMILRTSSKRSEVSLTCLVCANRVLLSSNRPYTNLEGFKVKSWLKF